MSYIIETRNHTSSASTTRTWNQTPLRSPLHQQETPYRDTTHPTSTRIPHPNGERAFNLTAIADGNIDWLWDPVFPGLDLSRILELLVEIAPTDFWSFWDNINTALKNLCNQQLVPRGPLKRLRIEINDTDWSTYWRFGVWTAGDLVPLVRTNIAVQDYENVLKRFREVVSKTDHCEIQLPYWIARSSAAKRIAVEWAIMGAQICIMPAAGLSDYEVEGRQCAGLSPLPDSLLP